MAVKPHFLFSLLSIPRRGSARSPWIPPASRVWPPGEGLFLPSLPYPLSLGPNPTLETWALTVGSLCGQRTLPPWRGPVCSPGHLEEGSLEPGMVEQQALPSGEPDLLEIMSSSWKWGLCYWG